MTRWTSTHRALGASCAALALCIPLMACQTPLERAYGVSQHAHTAQMIEDPEAGLRNRDIPYPDGRSADIATTKMRAQEKTIKAPVQGSLISGSGSAGGK